MNERRNNPTTDFEVRTKVWIERGGAVVISDFLAELLEAVAQHGSVAAAAEALGLPYRTAWKKLREMESAAGFALVESTSGGSSGGQTTLSAGARALIDALHRISDPTTTIAHDQFDLELKQLGDASPPRRRR
ncbi:MAG: LysR family transcriptional regulator [Chloroflexi bacterium]|nr:LysR family transcriptional regulator [Chloroflexota bacterium]MDA1148119.1 LysR family transcriptional regulator [Chloroflexota bacterium]